MNVLQWLRRLGILRFGAESAVYHDATERPISLQDKGVFNSKTDVIDLNRFFKDRKVKEEREKS